MGKFYIYAEYVDRSHLIDKHTIFPNKIFGSLIKPGIFRTPRELLTEIILRTAICV
jgi:hypothetical protein